MITKVLTKTSKTGLVQPQEERKARVADLYRRNGFGAHAPGELAANCKIEQEESFIELPNGNYYWEDFENYKASTQGRVA